VSSLICDLINLYVIVIILRIVLSWFPISPGSFLEQVNRILRTVTDPVLLPIRRIMPSMGGLDLSPMIVILLARVLVRLIC
jgi:YggT family protein